MDVLCVALSLALLPTGIGALGVRAERRLERLEDRMVRQPALEKALDAKVPERQLSIDGPGAGGGSRDRDQGMGL